MIKPPSPWAALLADQAPAPEAARASPDWPALLEQARHVDRDATASGWNVDLLHALQRAIEGREHAQLLALLDAGLPVPGFMAPLLADAMRAIVRGGRPKALTAVADTAIRSVFDALVHPDVGMSSADAVKQIAAAREVSIDVVRRSLKRTEP